MASLVPPKRGLEFIMEVALVSQADTDVFQTSVTLAAGDVTVSKNGGSFANVDTLPTEIGSTGVLILALGATETTADRITVKFHDVAGNEWCDLLVTICTVTRQIDDLAYPKTGGRGVDVDADGGVEVGTLPGGAIATAALSEIAVAIWENATRTLTIQPEGTVAFVYTLISRRDGIPIPDAYIWATTDLAGVTIVSSGFTNDDGRVTLYVDPGTIYIWARKSGWTFENPDIEEVEA